LSKHFLHISDYTKNELIDILKSEGIKNISDAIGTKN